MPLNREALMCAAEGDAAHLASCRRRSPLLAQRI